MEILFNVWLAFNIVFGIWTARNYLVFVWSVIISSNYSQSTFGQILDMLVLVSIISYLMST